MQNKTLIIRIITLIVITALILFLFIIKLVKYQLVDTEYYKNQTNTNTFIEVPLTAARGIIYDKNGNELATNKISYNIQLNKMFLTDSKLNDTIIYLIDILKKNNETFIDNLPLTTTYPYSFLPDMENEIIELKNNLDLAHYATAENVWDRLVLLYGLEDLPNEYIRSIAGIRYEMLVKEYSAVTPYLFANNVSITTVNILKEQSMSLPGVDIVEDMVRYYPDGTIIPHIIGSVGPIYKDEWDILKQEENNPYSMDDVIGKSGLEKEFEKELRGTDGILTVERTKDGTIIGTQITKEPIAGNNITLTIDKDLQLEVQKILEEQVRYIEEKDAQTDNLGLGKEGASIVVRDLEGAILASATYPNYDLNLYQTQYSSYVSEENNPLFNRALTGLYRPGSSYKTVVGLTALMNGYCNTNTHVMCTGVYDHWADVGFTPTCVHAHGLVDVKYALQESCNIFFYEMGRQMGYEQINKVSNALGLGVKTGVEIFENQGRLSSPETRENIINNQIENGVPPANLSEPWQEGDIVQLSIGQLDTQVTTLQLATLAGTLATKGTRYQSHFVKSIDSFDFNPEKQILFEPIVESQLKNVNNAFETIETGMLMAGKYFDGFATSPYKIAAKTGTPQVTNTKFNTTIIAYGPVPEPEISVAIIAENNTSSIWLGYGITKVFDAYYN